jgi:hypothetical protein
MLVLTMFLCLLDPCCVTFYLVRCLHKAAKRGKEEAWPFVPSQDITRQDLERFAHKHSLGHITVTSTDSVLTMTVEVWNLDEFTKFEAYGDKHSGTPGRHRVDEREWQPRCCCAACYSDPSPDTSDRQQVRRDTVAMPCEHISMEHDATCAQQRLQGEAGHQDEATD